MIPTLFDLQDIFFSEDTCINFLFDKEILYKQPSCWHCHRPMSRTKTKWKCTKQKYRKSISIFQHTIFSRAHIPCNKLILIGYLWLAKTRPTVIQRLTGHSQTTVANYLQLFRQLVSSGIKETEGQIGGEGIVVEIDESKFYHSHSTSESNTENGWVFGGVERTMERKVFIVRVPDRTANTLLEILYQNVRPGSRIISDCWSSYANITRDLGMEHQSVNHSNHFVDPVTRTHTNTIEGTWHGLKIGIPLRERSDEKIDDYLFEFIWHRENQGHEWEALLNCLHNTAFF